jgi:glutathione S-transferase
MVIASGHGLCTLTFKSTVFANFARCSMPNITLYHASPSRSSIVLWMLEEVGQPYDIKLIRLSAGDNLKPDYLAINPMGKVPTLKHGDTVITEGAAICTYLADEFPDKKLNIPVGNTRRGEYLKWLFFGPSVIEPAMTDRAFPRKENPRASALGWRDFDTVLDIVSNAVAKRPLSDGRAVHRRRRRDRFRPSLRHDVQDDSRAERISGLRRAHSTAAGAQACAGERQGIGGAGGLARLSAVAQDRGDQSPDDQDHRRPERKKGEQAGADRVGVGVAGEPELGRQDDQQQRPRAQDEQCKADPEHDRELESRRRFHNGAV